MAKKTGEGGAAVLSNEQYRDVVSGVRRIHRIARRLARIPEGRLSVDMDTALDVEYVNEWLDIILCRICGQQAVEMPAFPENPGPQELYRYCMIKARKQAGRIRFGLFTGRIGRELLTKNAWEGVDSAVSMLESVAAEQRRND